VDWPLVLSAGLVGALFGFWLPTVQHRIYREASFQKDPATGNRLRALRAFTIPAGALVAALAFRPDQPGGLESAVTAAFCLLLVSISSTDFDRRRIPNVLVYPGVVAALLVAPFWDDRSVGDVLFGGLAALGAAVLLLLVGLAVGLAFRAGESAFGIGDAKLIILIGLLTGWPAILTALLIGILLAGVVAVALLLFRGRGTMYSYGPFLAAGAVVVLLWFDRFG
jgi:leader peptidase (prepilin peptidase)/N-methyltransferase